MLIKNAIVLIDQINADLAGCKAPFQVIVDSGVIRLIPVAKAAGTTILGMMPLLTDAFLLSWPSPLCSDLVSHDPDLDRNTGVVCYFLPGYL